METTSQFETITRIQRIRCVLLEVRSASIDFLQHPLVRRAVVGSSVQRLRSGCCVLVFAFVFTAFSVGHAAAYPGLDGLPSVGSVDGYMRQGQPRDHAYVPRPSAGWGGQGFYGSPSTSRLQMNRAVTGVMILALWALERYQERHQTHALRNHHAAMRSRKRNRANSLWLPPGNGF